MSDSDPTSKSIVWEFLQNEAARTHDRTDWFLIFHAILFEAFFAKQYPSAIVGAVGVIVSFFWLMTGVRQSWLMMHLGKCMGSESIMGPEVSWTFNQVFEARRKGLAQSGRWRLVAWASPVPVFCVATPAVFLVAWAGLMYAYHGTPTRIVGVIIASVAGFAVVKWHGPGPAISADLVEMLSPSRRPHDTG